MLGRTRWLAAGVASRPAWVGSSSSKLTSADTLHYISHFSPISRKKEFTFIQLCKHLFSPLMNKWGQFRNSPREMRSTSCTVARVLFWNAYTSELWFNWMWPGTTTGNRRFIKTWQFGPYSKMPLPCRAGGTQPLQGILDTGTWRYDRNKGKSKA